VTTSDKSDEINHNNNNKMELTLQITTPVNLEIHQSQCWSMRQRSVSIIMEVTIHSLVVVVVSVVGVVFAIFVVLSMRNYILGGEDSSVGIYFCST